jgi:DNA (cytosine-5)-methyltransferase 1
MAARRETRLPLAVLDVCSGAGGAARGYVQAGFEVRGVDSNPRLREDYLGSGAAEFICADALEVLADRSFVRRFDFIHYSPPCQHFSQMARCRPGLAARYPDLITPGRPLLEAAGRPYVIENVAAARPWLKDPVTMCMWMLGRETYRHRLLEPGGGLTLAPPAPPPANGVRPNRECGWPHPVPTARAGHWQPGYFVSVAGHERKEPVRRVMEIGWMRNRDDVAEAIPPYLAHWIAGQLTA